MCKEPSQLQCAILNCMFNWLVTFIDRDVDECTKALHNGSVQFLIVCSIGWLPLLIEM